MKNKQNYLLSIIRYHQIITLCVHLYLQGVTRLFLTKIPFFREVIVSSFTCDHCGNSNAELQPAGRIQDKGVTYELRVTGVKVRSSCLHASIAHMSYVARKPFFEVSDQV